MLQQVNAIYPDNRFRLRQSKNGNGDSATRLADKPLNSEIGSR
jgi:hypothetical protein